MMSRMNHGFRVAFKAADLEKAKEKDADQKAAAKAAAEAVVEESGRGERLYHVGRRRVTIRKMMAKKTGLGKLKNPGGGLGSRFMAVTGHLSK